MEVKFEGIEELTQQLMQMEQGADEAKEEALNNGAKVMQEETKKLAPVRAVGGGTLRDNIQISDIKNNEIEVFVDNQGPAYYGYMLELGTSKMNPHPFMGPAFNKSKWKIEKALTDTLRKRLGLSE